MCHCKLGFSGPNCELGKIPAELFHPWNFVCHFLVFIMLYSTNKTTFTKLEVTLQGIKAKEGTKYCRKLVGEYKPIKSSGIKPLLSRNSQ